MKQRKLLVLLVAILSLTLLLVSCKGSDADEESATLDPTLIQNGAAQQSTDHEIRSYFNLENYAEAALYSEISRIDGKIVDYDRDHNLLAVKTEDLDVWNQVVETVKVYDLVSGEIINTQTQSNDYGADEYDRTYLSVSIHYPLIRVSRETRFEEEATEYSLSYYLAKKGAESLYSTDSNDFDILEFENGLVACEIGDKVFWIDKNMATVRTVDAVIANGYNVDEFNAEYMGYVYAWDSHSLQIFNRAGMCCAEYTAEKDAWIQVHVLNNGNALIQKLTVVDEYTPCDIISYGTRAVLTSYIMTYTDGAMAEVDLDFQVIELNTAYEEENDLPFALAEGRQNQAIIRKFAAEKYSVVDEYVVLDNEAKIEYALKNETVGVQIAEADALNANYYVAPVLAGGISQSYIFDLDGNKVARYVEENVNTRFIVTDNAIYDYNMTLVYDIAANGYTFLNVDHASANVFLRKLNFTTGAYETYLFNGSAATPVLLADGADAFYIEVLEGTYVTEDSNTDLYTLCDAGGKTFLIVYDDYDAAAFEDVLVIAAEFEGKHINYILK